MFGVQPRLALFDLYGNVADAGVGTLNVTLSIHSGPAGAILSGDLVFTLTSSLPVADWATVADKLKVNKVGQYVLKAVVFFPPLIEELSEPFTVLEVPVAAVAVRGLPTTHVLVETAFQFSVLLLDDNGQLMVNDSVSLVDATLTHDDPAKAPQCSPSVVPCIHQKVNVRE